MERKKIKIVAAIQARMGSKRLPDKAIKNLCGKTVIENIIRRLSQSKGIDEIVLATTEAPKDDILKKIASKKEIGCFRGPEEDVLGRLYGVAVNYKADAVLRITGDSPLIDPAIIDRGIEMFRNRKNSEPFLTTALPPTLPEGYNFEIVSRSLLEELNKELKAADLREAFMIHISRNPEKYSRIALNHPKNYSRIRLTLDYPEDWELIKTICEYFSQIGKENFGLMDVMNFLDANPKLIKINQQHLDTSKYPYSLGEEAVKKAI